MRARREDAGLGMVIVVMALMTSMLLAAGLLGVVATELRPTVYERKSERTIAAAQAGLQAGLAVVRRAWTTRTGATLNGDRTRLPCYSAAAPMTGQVQGLGSTQDVVTYAVRVSYFLINPAGRTAAWRTANALTCTPGSGPSATPVYALVQATGTSPTAALPAGRGDRANEAVYTFDRTDQSSLGGGIHSDPSTAGTGSLCWQAAATPAAVGTTIRLTTCAAGAEDQSWAYRKDYSIVLAGTQDTSTSPPTGGLCVSWEGSGPPTLQTCVSGDWRQIWAFDDSVQFQGVTAAKTAMSGKCLTTNGDWSVGAALQVLDCHYPESVWLPDRTVGPGASGPVTQQFVNYGEFARCLDITFWDVNYAWLIAYPCKQDPTQPVGWNQRWIWDGTGTRQLQANTSSGPYCLTTASAAGGHVVVLPCDAARTDQRWTQLGDTGNRSTAYTLVDDYGRCLSLGPPGTDSGFLSGFSSVTADPCDGSFRQKWNAPPQLALANVIAERETTGGR